MKKIFFTISSYGMPVILSTIVLALGMSCAKESSILGPGKIAGNARIEMRVIDAKTKADNVDRGALVREIPVEGSNGMVIGEFVSDITPDMFSTKGTIVTDSKINAEAQQFTIDGYLSDKIASSTDAPDADDADRADFHFIKGGTVQYSTSTGKWSWNGESPLWRNDIATTFWSYYPVSVAGRSITFPGENSSTPTDAQQKSLQFTYTLPTPSGDEANDAVAQPDLLFAYNHASCAFDSKGVKTSGEEFINIHFYHALAAVKFDITNVPAEYVVKEIAIESVSPSGECVITAPIDTEDPSKSFAWTAAETAQSYRQAFTSSDFEIVSGRNTQKISGEKVFFMIPQELGSSSEIKIVLQKGSEPEITQRASLSGDEWKAGKYYTYAYKRVNTNLELELINTGNIDSHYSNAILKIGKASPESNTLSISVPAGLPSTSSWLHFTKPVSADTPNVNPTDMVSFSDLFSKLTGSGEKTHLLEVGDYFYTQVVIDEYYYTEYALSSFVNAADRSATIKLSKAGSPDVSVTITQPSIKSPYDLSSSNPLGVELYEESDAGATNPCADRNLGGSGAWRQPTLQEYYFLWYGQYTLTSTGWPILSDAPYATSETGVLGRYDGVASTWGPLSGTGLVRCVRNLGSGAPDPMYTINDRIVTMQNVGNGSLRTTTKTGEYSTHTVTEADNKLPAKFKVASMNQKYETGTYVDIDLPSAFCINLSMDAQQVPVISRTGSNVSVTGGKIQLSPFDEVFYFTATFEKAQGAGTPTSNTVTITKDGQMSFNMEINWNAGNNAFLTWNLQPHYVDKDGVDHKLGEPSSLYLVLNKSGAPGPIGSNDDTKRPGAKIVSNTINDASGEYKWYFSLKTVPASDLSYQKPLYDEFYFPDQVSNSGCNTYYEETEANILTNTTTHPDLGKWRVPNQRELSIILMNASALGITMDTDSHFSSKTIYSDRPYYYYNGEYTTTSGNLTERQFKIRCVRDL